jgi:hypothetical protein
MWRQTYRDQNRYVQTEITTDMHEQLFGDLATQDDVVEADVAAERLVYRLLC